MGTNPGYLFKSTLNNAVTVYQSGVLKKQFCFNQKAGMNLHSKQKIYKCAYSENKVIFWLGAIKTGHPQFGFTKLSNYFDKHLFWILMHSI